MAKKEWISVFHTESKENFTKTEQINWESSSSEDEHSSFNKKKRKQLSEINCNISPIINYQGNNVHLKHTNDRAIPFTRSTESPVIGSRRLELYKLSPELSQRSASIFFREHSPVLDNRCVKFKKRRCKSRLNSLIRCLSPDLFELECTQNISSESPTRSSVFNVCNTQATMHIEPFPSQFSSQVIPANNEIKEIPLYYQPPKRKKSYRKGGLAYQLDKALKVTKSRVKIWQHEQIHNIERGFESQTDDIRFKLKKIWNQYGNNLLLCEVTNVDLSLTPNKNAMDGRIFDDIFLVNIGASCILNIEWEKDNIYRLFPPYEIERVKYCGQDIMYFSNASRFLTC